jgi:response regulator RpfG family c-di-GMP phosphodiesterase
VAEPRHKIVVADDDKLIVAMIGDLLSDRFDVLTAHDGDAALEHLKHQQVIAVICDQVMPGVAGVEVLQRCVEMQPSAARILVTASEDPRDIRDAINLARVHRVILKPIREAEIDAAIAGAVRECLLEQENARLIDELKKALADVTRHEAELEHELRVRTEELKELTERLVRAGG